MDIPIKNVLEAINSAESQGVSYAQFKEIISALIKENETMKRIEIENWLTYSQVEKFLENNK